MTSILTTTPITIRPAVQGDVDAIVAFQVAMAMESEGTALDSVRVRKGVEAVLNSPERGVYFLAEAEGRVVGGLMVTLEWSDWRNANFWWIQSVYVLPDWRRKGVYRAMHEYVRQEAASREDVCGLRLYVEENNHIARKTYQSLGMKRSQYLMYEIDFGE